MANKRHHPLVLGERVFDTDNMKWGVITKLNEDKSVLELNGEKWTADTESLYQVADGIKDTRLDDDVCWEHQLEQYPFYSPALDENLYIWETYTD